jgi:hypothetical protein
MMIIIRNLTEQTTQSVPIPGLIVVFSAFLSLPMFIFLPIWSLKLSRSVSLAQRPYPLCFLQLFTAISRCLYEAKPNVDRFLLLASWEWSAYSFSDRLFYMGGWGDSM